MAKVQISIDDELLKRIDSQAEAMYMSRSGFISSSCAQVLNSTQMVVAITEMSLALRKMADTGIVDDENMQKLLDFERLVKMVTSQK